MKIKPSQFEEHATELESLRSEFAGKALIHDREVQGLLENAYATWSPAIFKSVTRRLRLILDAHNTDAQRKPDPFRPYGPSQLLRQGSLHLLDQMDGVPFLIDPNKLVTGMLVLGPQNSGKSRFLRYLCDGLSRTSPDAKITIIDAKAGFGSLQGFRHVDLADISFDLAPPHNASQSTFIYEFMPILADTAGLIYGLDLLNRATDIALSQLQQYRRQGTETHLCLKDIFEALLLIKVSHFREVGYHDACKTALSLILGKQNLFSCRRGISLDWLFAENTVINASSLTHEMQCKAFVLFLIFWLYQQARSRPESNQLGHVLIIDDATRFIGTGNQFSGQKKTSQLGHLLAVLRSKRVTCVFATQLPAQVDPAVLSLCRNGVIVGNISGEEHLRVIQNFMSLTPEQKSAILQFQARESLAFVSGSAWPRPIHGWVPFVEDVLASDAPKIDTKRMVSPWHPLTQLPRKETSEQVSVQPKEKSVLQIKSDAEKLVYDRLTYPYDKVRECISRVGISVRSYEAAKNAATQDGYLIHSSSGKSVYLIPTKKAYERFQVPYPYARSSSAEHSFYAGLAAHIRKQDPNISRVQTETPIGQKGATIDVTTTSQSGEMTAIEVTLSTSNLLSNASKLQDTAYAKVIWLAKDAATAKAIQAYFSKSATLPDELTAKFEYIHFSKFARQHKGRK